MTERSNIPDSAAGFKVENSLPPEITLSKEIDLSGKVAIVTGASRGIGRAIALKLAYHGADVVINSRESSKQEAHEVKKIIQSFGRRATYVEGDVTSSETREKLVDAANEMGQIDILVNNAGITRDNLAIRMTDEELDEVIAVNEIANARMTRDVLKSMLVKRSGQIINISSISANGGPGQSNYAAAKAGSEAYHKSVATEMASRNIKVNSIEIGLVEGTGLTSGLTDKQKEGIVGLTATKKPVGVEEVADLVVYLASGRLPSMTRQVINLDGGSLK